MTTEALVLELRRAQLAIHIVVGADEGAADISDLFKRAADRIETQRNVVIDECMAVAENVCFRPTQDDRAKDGRIRCSVDDLLVRLAALKSTNPVALISVLSAPHLSDEELAGAGGIK